MEKNLKFNSIVKDVKKINPLFSSATVYTLYSGVNRNNSHMSKSVIENSLNSIFNIPIIGEFLEGKNNFGGHGGKLEITDTDVKYVSTTKPYGVVPESANIYWEDVTEKDGSVNEYLVVEGVYLWTGRYPELSVILEQGRMNHSMEIEVNNGAFAIIDNQEVFEIKDFTFSGLCILGIDKGDNPDDHVEPCFESSSIIVNYSLDKDKFKKEYSQMLAELKFSVIDSKGGNENLEKEKQEFEEVVTDEIKVEETVVTETEEVFEETAEVEIEEVSEIKVEETVEEPTEVETEEVFEEITVESEVLEDVVDEMEKITEEVIDLVVEAEELQINEFEVKFNDLSEQYKSIQSELEELRAFKRETLEKELSDKFEGQLDSKEISDVFENSKGKSIDEIQIELFALVGKKNFSIQKETTKEVKIAVAVEKDSQKSNDPYNGFFEKYLDKK